jgi:2-oxoglutarate ferredoxin oxidoreductase subunit alpha
MHDLTVLAFELSDKYRTPVMVLADGRLGQMMEPVRLHEGPPPPVPSKPWAVDGAKGRKPNMIRSLLLVETELEGLNIRLQNKYRTIAEQEVRWEERAADDCEILLVAYGTSARIAKGCLDTARANGIKVGLLRPISLWPFPAARLSALAARAKAVLVIEMSSGQMVEDVRLAVAEKTPVAFEGRMGGVVPTESDILRRTRELSEGVRP